MFGYTCPWCPTVVVDVGDDGPAVAVFEAHLDDHYSSQLEGAA